MATLTATDTVSLQLEGVSRTLPLLVEKEAKLDSRFKDMGRAERVSTRNYRITMQHALPGVVAKVNLDGGDLPRGGHSQYDVGTITPLSFCVPLEMSLLAKMTGQGQNISIEDVVSRNIADCISTLSRMRDIFLNTDGTGKLAVVDSVNGNVITLRSASTTTTGEFGAHLLGKQQTIQVFNGNALRNSCTILDKGDELGATQTITVDQVPAGTAAGDIIRVDGVENGAPVFVNGIPVFHSNATTGSSIGISRSNSYVVATSVNAAGAAITQPMLRLARNKTRNALGDEGMKGQFVHTHISQVDSWEQLGYPMMVIPMNDGKGPANFDPTFSGKKTMDGMEILDSIHASNSRIDIVAPAVWGKVTWSDGPFWFDLEGQKVWPIPAAAGTGSLSTAFISFLIDTLQYFVDNAKACTSVTSLGVPPGN